MDFFYRIEGLSPLCRNSARYNFNIALDPAFARRALTTSLKASKRKDLESLAQSLVKEMFGEWNKPCYVFLEKSCLVHSIGVPGNATALCLNYEDKNELYRPLVEESHSPVLYVSCNVDSPVQTCALLSNFLTWFDSIEPRVNGRIK